MTNDEFLTNIDQLYDEAFALIKPKSADYTAKSPDPFRAFRASFLLTGTTIEKQILDIIGHKLSRISGLLENDPQVVTEKLDDTIKDTLNYLAILSTYRKSARLN